MKFTTFALLLLLPLPAFAGSIDFVNGEDCVDSGGSVSCTPTAGRGTLLITAKTTTFVELRDALTPNWTGSWPCDRQEQIDAGFCAALGDVATTDRQEAAMQEIVLDLRAKVIEDRIDSANTTATAGVNKVPDIGG